MPTHTIQYNDIMCKRKADTIEGEPIAASTIDGHLWVSIIEYLESDDLKNLRLASSKNIALCNPLFTSHLPLVIDRVPFFGSDTRSLKYIISWLYNRRRLVINGRSKNIHPLRVASLVKSGVMNSITEIVINDCSCYRSTIFSLAKLPNLKHMKLLDECPSADVIYHRGKYYDRVVEETTAIVESLKSSTKLETLDIEFDW